VTSEMLVKAIWRALLSQEIQYSSRTQANTDQFKRVQQILWALAERARNLGIGEETVVRHVMLKATVDGEFTTVADVAEVALLCAGLASHALTEQTFVVSRGWFLQ
jgi:3-hydroxybutyrate dehydrogenase